MSLAGKHGDGRELSFLHLHLLACTRLSTFLVVFVDLWQILVAFFSLQMLTSLYYDRPR